VISCTLITAKSDEDADAECAFVFSDPNNPGRYYITVPSGWESVEPTLAHEYGHWFMYVQYGSETVYASACGTANADHVPCDTTKVITSQVAWCEGYADAFALIYLNSGTVNFGQSTGSIDFETYSCSGKTVSNDEGWVAALIYDLFDPQTDNNGGSSARGRSGTSYFGSTVEDNNGAHIPPVNQILALPLNPHAVTNINDYVDTVIGCVLSVPAAVLARSLAYYNYANAPAMNVAIFNVACVTGCTSGSTYTASVAVSVTSAQVCSVSVTISGTQSPIGQGCSYQGSVSVVGTTPTLQKGTSYTYTVTCTALNSEIMNTYPVSYP